jgi:hypothetical protein
MQARGVAEGLEQARLQRKLAEQPHLFPLGDARRVGGGVDINLLRRRHDLDLCFGHRRRDMAQSVAKQALAEVIGLVVHCGGPARQGWVVRARGAQHT